MASLGSEEATSQISQLQLAHEKELTRLRREHELELRRLRKQLETEHKEAMTDVYRRVGSEMARTRATRDAEKAAGINKMALNHLSQKANHQAAVMWPMRYFDEFLLLRCRSDLLDCGGN